jgi:hypothetical protein
MIRAPRILPLWAESCSKSPPSMVRAVLALLAKSRQYASSARCDKWQYAEELGSLRATGASNSDLRWLLHKGYVVHREEMTRRGSPSRAFRKLGPLELRERACFVITDSGETLLRRIGEGAAIPRGANGGSTARETIALSSRRATPTWDRLRRELRVGKVLVKCYRCPAPSQELVLAAFQEEGWPFRIDDPLPQHTERDRKQCLHDTIHHLNRNQINAAVHFGGDGTGRGICWQLLDAEPRPRP